MRRIVIISASGQGKVVASPDENKSVVTYDPSKPDTLQSMLDWSKTKRELGYEPEYDFVTMMKDFKREMETEPMAKLWGTGAYYDDLYKDQV